MKSYTKPTLTSIELRPEERLAGSWFSNGEHYFDSYDSYQAQYVKDLTSLWNRLFTVDQFLESRKHDHMSF